MNNLVLLVTLKYFCGRSPGWFIEALLTLLETTTGMASKSAWFTMPSY